MTALVLHAKWIDNATAGLTHSVGADLPLLKAQVNAGTAQLWEINTHKGKSWMISRLEITGDQKELVVCCFEGCDLTRISSLIYQSAQQQGIDSIRFHTKRKGLNRLIEHLGFTPYEVVYRKSLHEPLPEPVSRPATFIA
jgi:hypothetical protein